jgi:hypothetical protein
MRKLHFLLAENVLVGEEVMGAVVAERSSELILVA